MQERLNVGYSQQYDDRGHPCNPFAQYWASEMRQAQNDVLAAVGVVKRNDDQEQEHRQLDVQEVAKRLDFEKSVGATLETSFVALLICTKWCFDSFRLRLMVRNTMQFYLASKTKLVQGLSLPAQSVNL